MYYPIKDQRICFVRSRRSRKGSVRYFLAPLHFFCQGAQVLHDGGASNETLMARAATSGDAVNVSLARYEGQIGTDRLPRSARGRPVALRTAEGNRGPPSRRTL